MKCVLSAGLVVGALVLGNAPAVAAGLPGIRGGDDRELVDSTASPWNAIGRVNREGGGFCTGVAVGRRTVLTAAHCLWNRRTLRWGGAQTIHFLAGYRHGEYVQHARVSSYRVGARGLHGPQRRPADDWAILTLQSDLERSVTPLGVTAVAGRAAAHLQAGYHQDTPHMLSVHRNCRMSTATAAPGLLIHDCDAAHGSSGSPLLSRNGDGEYSVVGLHVGHSRDGEIGVAIPAMDILSRQNGERIR